MHFGFKLRLLHIYEPSCTVRKFENTLIRFYFFISTDNKIRRFSFSWYTVVFIYFYLPVQGFINTITFFFYIVKVNSFNLKVFGFFLCVANLKHINAVLFVHGGLLFLDLFLEMSLYLYWLEKLFTLWIDEAHKKINSQPKT